MQGTSSALLIGGSTTNCPGGASSCLETWSFSNGSWADVTQTSATAPPALNATSFVYDTADKEAVLYGGYCAGLSCSPSGFSNQTWVFQVTGWILLKTSTSPGNRSEAAITYDDSTGFVLLFGGLTLTSTGTSQLADTWNFASGNWSQLLPALSSEYSAVDIGVTTTFHSSGSGIYGYATYAYTGLPTGCRSEDLAALTCSPSSPGLFQVGVTVQYPGTGASEASTELTVASLPAVATFDASSNPVAPDSSTSLAVEVAGGTGPFTFSYGGLPSGCSSSNVSTLTCTPTVSGRFSISVLVTDRFDRSANGTLQLTVGTPHGGVTLGSALDWLATPIGELLVLLPAVAGVTLSAVIVRGRRMRREGEELIDDVRKAVSDGRYTRNRPP